MKTAILLSGHMRTFALCLPTLHHHIFADMVPGDTSVDFFVCTVQDQDAASAELLRARYPGCRVEIKVIPDQPVLPLPAGCPDESSWVRGQPFMHEPYAISVPPQAVLRQLWQLNQAWEHFSALADFRSYDRILRVRPDSYMHSYRAPTHLYSSTLSAQTPWWGRFGGANDRFAVLGADAARQYFTTYIRIADYISDGVPLHPESLVYHSLRSGGCHVRDMLEVDFSTMKNTAEGLQVRPPEIMLQDLAHVGLWAK